MDENPPMVRLPGIGHRLDVSDRDGRPVHLIRYHSGDVDIALADGTVACSLDRSTAMAVGAFTAGHLRIAPGVSEHLADVVGALELDWIELEPGDPAAGRTIGSLEIRKRTGTTIVAVVRGSTSIVAPGPETTLQVGDVLVVIGREGDRDACARVLRGAP